MDSSDDIVKCTFSIDWQLLKKFDEIISRRATENRSLMIRTLINDYVLSNDEGIEDGLYLIIVVADSPVLSERYPVLTIPIELIGKKQILSLCLVEGSKKELKRFTRECTGNLGNIAVMKVVGIGLK